jgi:hypothetical protein
MANIAPDSPDPGDDDRRGDRPEDATPPEPAKPYEFVVWHNGKQIYRFKSDSFVLFDDVAVTDPAELAKLREPNPDA